MRASGQDTICKLFWPKTKSRLTFQKVLSLQRKTNDVFKSFTRTIRSFYLHFQCNFLEYDYSVKYKNKTFMDQKKKKKKSSFKLGTRFYMLDEMENAWNS